MSVADSIILGILQGLTEFLPVSSSGHLVLMHAWLGMKDPMVFFDVILHFGTLMAIFVIYRKDLAAIAAESVSMLRTRSVEGLPNARFFLVVIAATVPAGVLGLLFEDRLEELFAAPTATGFMLLVTGVILFVSRNAGGRTQAHDVAWKAAILIGFAQACALMPGISRSGSTIAAALLLGLERESAARFSFILSIPAVAGATLLKTLKSSISADEIGFYLAGFVASFVIGIVALSWLINLVRRGKLVWFSYYVWAVGFIVIGIGFWG